ncbi:MAG: 2-oxoacid:ferredoxin oxidoreductase subunit beta [Pseudomonadales bacterium]|nr:2-oxoacid:ferredoxin oxidoreductase subunit beta [Pseudomonadales bacterium]
MKPKAYKSGVKPIWCPGCGHYSVLNAITKALSVLDQQPEDCVLVSGIGCSARLPAYANAYGFHGVHGRALPVATGIKVARPKLNVIAMGGDGDGFSIGGNHFLHACRRNVDIVYIAMDNEVYGMTKGQASPTTPELWDHSKLTPHGPEVRPFQPCSIALASGASFIARGHSGDPNGLAKMIYEAIEHPGFAFVHVLSQCITYCPEQSEWKERVHDEEVVTADPTEAATFLQREDGFSKGVFYRNPRDVWPMPHQPPQDSNLRKGFEL